MEWCIPAIATGQVKQTRAHAFRSESALDTELAAAKSAQKAATKRPAVAHIAIRYFIVAISTQLNSTPLDFLIVDTRRYHKFALSIHLFWAF